MVLCSHCLLLHRGVHDDALQFALLDGADIDCRVDGGAEQLFQAGFSQHATWTWGLAKVSDLRGITRGPGIDAFEAGKVLPVDVLGKALHQFFIAEIETVLVQGQGDHEPRVQPRATGVAGCAAADSDNGAGQVKGLFACAQGPYFVGELRRHSGLHLLPRQP